MSQPDRFLVLTHGAGSNASSPLLLAVAKAFEDANYFVLRYDLPFRQARPHGPPLPANAAQDRAGLESAVRTMRERANGRPVILGGHSYGGRQSSMLAAEKPDLVDALLLLSYPLHPPRKPEQLWTAHLPDLRTSALFVHGTRDPFGSPEEMRQAIALIPARTGFVEVERAGHDLAPLKWTARAVAALGELI
jgi:predicted alpha/beta-hydrolase family hydrolase